MREMVYVELVARYGGAWADNIEGDPQRAQKRDSRLRHMPTRETLSTSYVLFSQLCRTVSRRWVLFREYLPPKDIWDARISEVEQIRNRVAHFRRGHPDDIKRVQQFLRDIDRGFWKFCTSYNDTWPIEDQNNDPVARELNGLDPFPWTEVQPNTHVRIGIAPSDLTMAANVGVLRRPWLKARKRSVIDGHYGYLYDVTLTARGSRSFNYDQLLKSTQHVHDKLCHVCLDSFAHSIRFTIPCVAGSVSILSVVRHLLSAARNALLPTSTNFQLSSEFDGMAASNAIDKLAMQWPENVLGPGNPLAFLSPEMPCSFFGLSD